MRVLIADDETPIRQWMSYCIGGSKGEFEVAGEAETGAEALELFERLLPDIVLTDIVMPGSDGLDFIERARKISPEACFIVMTCHENFEYACRSIENKVFKYIVKYRTGEKELMQVLREAREHILLARQMSSMAHSYRHLEQENALRALVEQGEDPQPDGALQSLDISFQNFVGVAMEGTPEAEGQALALCKREFGRFCHCRTRGKLFLVGNVGDSASQLYSLSRLHEFARKLEEGAAVRAGISDIFSGRPMLSLAAAQALRALDSCFFGKRCAVRFHYDLPLQDEPVLSRLEEPRERVLEALKLGQYLPALEHFRGLLGQASGIVLGSSGLYKSFVMDILFQICFHGMERKGIQGISPQGIRRELEGEDTIDAFHEKAEACCRGLFYSLLREEEGRRLGKDVITQVRLYIEEHYAGPVSLEEIADFVHLNPSYLSGLYKQKTGENISTYLTAVRLDRAEKLILETNLRLSQIAALVGYPNASYFSQIYKKYRGVSPTDLREQKEE